MFIEYKNRKIKEICTSAHVAKREYGLEMAEKIQQRISEIESAVTVEMMIQYRIGRCHLLKGDRKNQFAVDLVHPYRLVFEKKKKEFHIVRIMEITDYH